MLHADIALHACLNTIGHLQARVVGLEIEKAALVAQLEEERSKNAKPKKPGDPDATRP